MLSDLQLALLVAGAAFLIGVFAYNKFQERRLQRRIDARLGEPRADALLGASPTGADPAPAVIDAAPGAAANAPQASPITPVEHELGLPPIETAAPPASMLPGMLDPRLDYIATIAFSAPQPGEEILRLGTEMVRGAKAVNWEGFASEHDAWRAVVPAARYRQVRAGLQLVDRLGVVTDAQIVEFCQSVQAFAATLVGEPAFAGRAQALRVAAELDALAAQADIQIGLNVLKTDGTTIPAVQVRSLAESAGLLLDDDGRFRMLTPEGSEVLSVGNMEATPFVEQAIPRTATRGVTLTLDVPRSPDGDATFRQFTDFAENTARTLEGDLVDDNRQPISPQALAGIGRTVAATRATLREAGIPAGSPLALRLFSP